MIIKKVLNKILLFLPFFNPCYLVIVDTGYPGTLRVVRDLTHKLLSVYYIVSCTFILHLYMYFIRTFMLSRSLSGKEGVISNK